MLAWIGFNMLQCNNYTHELTSSRVLIPQPESEDKSSEYGTVFFSMQYLKGDQMAKQFKDLDLLKPSLDISLTLDFLVKLPLKDYL